MLEVRIGIFLAAVDVGIVDLGERLNIWTKLWLVAKMQDVVHGGGEGGDGWCYWW